MKVVVVKNSELPEALTNDIKVHLSSLTSYGLFDLDDPRLIAGLCREFGLTYEGEKENGHELSRDNKSMFLVTVHPDEVSHTISISQ